MNVTNAYKKYCCDARATLTLGDNVRTLSDDVETLNNNDSDKEQRREDTTW